MTPSPSQHPPLPTPPASSKPAVPSADLLAATRRIAAALLRDERSWHTLQPTELVHEAWIRLAAMLGDDLAGADQMRLRALFAKVMRQVLVDHARARAALKRSGGADHEPIHHEARPHGLSPGPVAAESPEEICGRLDDTLLLDSLLLELAEKDGRAACVVELRYFAGLTIQETALALGISDFAVEKDWRVARAWLAVQMRRRRDGDVGPAGANAG